MIIARQVFHNVDTTLFDLLGGLWTTGGARISYCTRLLFERLTFDLSPYICPSIVSRLYDKMRFTADEHLSPSSPSLSVCFWAPGFVQALYKFAQVRARVLTWAGTRFRAGRQVVRVGARRWARRRSCSGIRGTGREVDGLSNWSHAWQLARKGKLAGGAASARGRSGGHRRLSDKVQGMERQVIMLFMLCQLLIWDITEGNEWLVGERI